MSLRNLAIAAFLTVSLAACGRAEFGTTSGAGAVVDSDVERETPNSSDNSGSDGDNLDGDDGFQPDLGSGAANNVSAPEEPPPSDQGAPNLTGDFAFSLYGDVAAQGRNGVVSPHGMARALIVAYTAANPEDAQAISDALTPYLGGDVLEQFNARDLDYEARESSAAFDMVSAVWADQSVAVEQDFVDAMARYTGLELRLIDFEASPEDARTSINNWFSTETNGRISEVVGPRSVDANTRFLITDAAWFAAPWSFGGFDPELTTYENFAGSEADVQVPMMSRTDTFLYAAAPDLDAVVLPMESGFSLIAVVPTDLEAFENALSGDFLDRLVGEAAPTALDLRFPKLEVSDRVRLSDVATSLGVDGVLADDAYFGGFADDTTLSDAHQRTRIAFDEAGVMGNTGMTPSDPTGEADEATLEVAFDRPFFFAIRDEETGRYFMLGRLAQP